MSTKGFLGTEIEGEINRLEIKRRRDDEEEEGEGEGGEEREILSKNIFFFQLVPLSQQSQSKWNHLLPQTSLRIK